MKDVLEAAKAIRFRMIWEDAKAKSAVTAIALFYVNSLIELIEQHGWETPWIPLK